MPITAITYQPATSGLSAAYRPILYLVTATATDSTTLAPPIVFCDIYFGGVFYKSLSKTLALSTGEWQFDIQDAAQEYLRKYLAPNGGEKIYPADQAMTSVYCKFRSSKITSDGFILYEGVAPVQGTGNRAPSTGTGTQSNMSYIVNSTLQHEDNQVLTTHLNTFKSGTWGANVFPLSHRPATNSIKLGRSDYFPIVNIDNSPIKGIITYYRYKGQTTFNHVTKVFANACPVVIPSVGLAEIDSTTQRFRFTWQTLPYYTTGVKIEYRKTTDTGDFSVAFADPNPAYIDVTAPKGKYDIYFTAFGSCEGGRTGYLQDGLNP
ncbi:hypothetical protein [Chitinophaga sp. LS1]|uniref:hypothetical protein n=1 Tax=Chitinophaga sp. LS1 TaxID=3051176 RepID=UPI002AAB93E2|nr:hypothetical protein [Chitinophaga sp. LS1]WPV66287.1 hypothetical protein QQL36_31305 [Chitinophaga sp. LS1]